MVTDSRARMISAAEHLFRVQGLHATGLAEVLEQSGAPRGSLYHYFPGGKDELAGAALSTASARIEAALASLVERTGSVPGALRAYGVAECRRPGGRRTAAPGAARRWPASPAPVRQG